MTIDYKRRWEPRRGGARRDAGREESPEAQGEETSYYGLPVIHGPHWNWLIVVYFFLGGIAGASYALASIAELLGSAGNRRIARAGRYLSVATLLPCPVLLILDLGQPSRFHHMLRVLKLRSPLSVGTWTLTIFGGVCGLSAVAQAARDGLLGEGTLPARVGLAVPSRALGAAGLAPAFFLSGYTGTLLGATAVPLWQRNTTLLGPLFVSSALANASAALGLILAADRRTDAATIARLERLDGIAQAAELALLLTAQARLGPTIARPLTTGSLGTVYKAGALGTGIGLPLVLRLYHRLRGQHPTRPATALSSCLTLIGGLLFRYAILYAGRRSADDPRATFELTR